jgi:hypothetical protein
MLGWIALVFILAWSGQDLWNWVFIKIEPVTKSFAAFCWCCCLQKNGRTLQMDVLPGRRVADTVWLEERNACHWNIRSILFWFWNLYHVDTTIPSTFQSHFLCVIDVMYINQCLYMVSWRSDMRIPFGNMFVCPFFGLNNIVLYRQSFHVSVVFRKSCVSHCRLELIIVWLTYINKHSVLCLQKVPGPCTHNTMSHSLFQCHIQGDWNVLWNHLQSSSVHINLGIDPVFLWGA